MRYILEFGVRGGAHVENEVFTTRAQAERMARRLVMVFSNDPHANGATDRDWLFYKGVKRMEWKNLTHFVALSVLDGIPRGPAAAHLWRKPTGDELLANTVSIYH